MLGFPRRELYLDNLRAIETNVRRRLAGLEATLERMREGVRPPLSEPLEA